MKNRLAVIFKDVFLTRHKYSNILAVVYFIILIVPIVYVCGSSYVMMSKVLTALEIEHKESVIDLSAKLVYEKLSSTEQLGIDLASRPVLVDAIGRGDWAKAIEGMSRIADEDPILERIFIADKESFIRADSLDLALGVGTSRTQTDWYKGVSKNWQPYVSEVFLRPSLPRRNVIDIAIPVKSSGDATEDSPVLGILILQIEMGNLEGWVKDVRLQKGETLYIVDQKGDIVYHPRFLAKEGIADFSTVPIISKVLRGQEGVGFNDNPVEKGRWFSAYKPINRFGWGVVIEEPATTAFSERDVSLKSLLFIDMAFIALSVLLIFTVLYLLRSNQKKFQQISGLYEDLKHTQIQLLQSEKMASVGQLAAGMAHEINNPIGFIGNNMEILEENIAHYTKMLKIAQDLIEKVEQADMEKALPIAQEMARFKDEIDLDFIIKDMDKLFGNTKIGLERVQKIVSDLRTFARQDSGNLEPIKIEEVIDGILGIVNSELKYKAELKKNYGETPLIKGSPQRLGQVFINLFVNAAQAIEEKGVITVETYCQNGFVCVDVRDSGKGIAPENLKKIFDPFFTTKPVGQGTGLGLSVSYEIIKKHGGEIKVSSKMGEGTTFTVMLPVKSDNA